MAAEGPDVALNTDHRRHQQQDQQGISQAEAEQLLDALKEREMDAQKRRYRATGQSRGKDW